MHRTLGSGLLESVCEGCLAYELSQRKIPFLRQHPVPVTYKGMQFNQGYRLDLLVNSELVVEVKAVSAIQPIHEALLLSYLKLSHCPLGLIINFHTERLNP